jgi:hypothetical protein
VSLWVRFTATERRETGAAHRVLIEPSLDDPCTALCIIDWAPKPRAADGKLSDAARSTCSSTERVGHGSGKVSTRTRSPMPRMAAILGVFQIQWVYMDC